MKAVIPAAGVGTRLRPHTLTRPKALLPVAGKPIIGHIVDDLHAAGIEGFVIIVGFKGDAVREWFANERPNLSVTMVEQAERLGLGHAIWTAKDHLAEQPFFCILGDTILKADYRRFLAADRNLIGVCEVEDPRRFGIVEIDGGRVTRFVEKPAEPRSNLAIVGAYLIRDSQVLWRALDRVIQQDVRTRGEYQLTDALQIMLDESRPFGTVSIDGWYDCGKPETWLETNRALLDLGGDSALPEGATPPCAIGAGVELLDSRIGPHVSIGPGARIDNCDLRDCIVGAGARLAHCRLRGSLVGEESRLQGVVGQLNVGDFSELRLAAR